MTQINMKLTTILISHININIPLKIILIIFHKNNKKIGEILLNHYLI